MSPIPSRRLLNATMVLSLLMPLTSFSQVIIREKVEINPKAVSKNQSRGKPQLQLNGSSGDYFDPPLFAGGGTTLGEAIAARGEIGIQGAIDGNQEAVLTVQLNPSQDRPIAWKGRQPIPWGGNMYEGQSTYYDTVGGGSGLPDIQLYRFIGDRWGVNGTRDMSISAFGERVNYSFEGVLYQWDAPIVKITATATVTGSFLPNVKFDHWNIKASDMTVFGRDSTYMSCFPIDGNGGGYAPAGMDQAKADVNLTWQVSTSGDYEYISYIRTIVDDYWNVTDTYYAGQQLTTSLYSGVYVVYDKSKGTFDGQSDTVYVTVSGGGRSKTVPVVLTKGVPCDRVTITPPWVIPGGSAAISIQKNNGDGTFSEYPAGQQFDAMIVEAGNMGTLVSPDSSGTVLSGVIAPLKYVAPKTFDGSFLNVHLAVSAHNSTGISSSAVAAQSSNLAEGRTAKLQAKSWGKSPRESVVASLGKMLAESACPPAAISVEKMVCNRLSVNPSTPLLPGGTAALTLFIDNGDGTTSEFSADETFYIVLSTHGVAGDPGTIVASNGSGTTLMGAIPPITYVAPSTMGSDSLEVLISFAPMSEIDLGAADVASSVKSSTLRSEKLSSTAAASKKMSKESLQEAFGKSLAQSSCGPTKVKVKKARVPISMSFMPSSTKLSSSESAKLIVKLFDSKEIPPDQNNSTVNFSLGTEAQVYGQLNDTTATGMKMGGVPYRDAYGGSVTVKFDKKVYDEIFPLRVKVTASALSFSQFKIISAVGPHTTGEYLNQGDSAWANDIYGSSKDSIRKQGCALSALAMILRAIGVDEDPGTLNRKMVQDTMYRGALRDQVDFKALEYYAGQSGLTVRKARDVGSGLRRKAEGIVDAPPLPDFLISDALSDEDFAIAEVKSYHQKDGTTHKHFVLITSMSGTDPATGRHVYSILDPGRSDLTTLDDYSNNVYRLITYRKL